MASEARMKKVRSLRRGNRAAITRNSHKASDALGEEDMDILVLRQCKRTLEEKLAALGPLDAEILDSTAEENVVTEMEEAATITEDTELTILRLNKAIEELEASGSTRDGASKVQVGLGLGRLHRHRHHPLNRSQQPVQQHTLVCSRLLAGDVVQGSNYPSSQ